MGHYPVGGFKMTSGSARLVAVGVAALVFCSLGVLTAQAPRLSVGGDIKRPAKIRHVSPVYPKEALDKKIGGTVLLEIVIATDGTVLEVKVTQGVHRLLDEAAAKAVSQWKYVPTKVNGQPVELVVPVDVTFTPPA
jgi:TonB family protein